MKTIFDYFEDSVDYPDDIAYNPIPYGVLWQYVSDTFLNGFINYASPIACFVVDRYTAMTDVVDEAESFPDGSPLVVTKDKLITQFLDGKQPMNTVLSRFRDDVVILSRIPKPVPDLAIYVDTLITTGLRSYLFFYFDMDNSDCSIGRFQTYDHESLVIASVENWLAGQKRSNEGKAIHPNIDNGILDYHAIPVSSLTGWIKF